MASVVEIAPDIFRLCTYVPPPLNLQFCQFLVRDEEPLLFHTGLRALLPSVMEGVASLIDPAKLRWIAFSHYEADECGTMNDFLALNPHAQVACGLTAKLVSVDDMAARPARPLADSEVLATGKYRFRFLRTPHVPHAWEAGLMFEEVTGTLFCSDLGFHWGDVAAVTEDSIAGRMRAGLVRDQGGPIGDSFVYGALTGAIMERLADLSPKTLAVMHGSTYVGDGAGELRRIAAVLKDIFGGPA